MRNRIATLALAAICAALPLQVSAQTQIVTPVPYVSGGVGVDEREALQQEAKQEGYNLKVVATATDGAYLAGITVRIADAQGVEVLQAAMDGPWLYVKLPAGRYTLSADDGRQTHKRAVDVPAQGTRETVFRWERAAHTPKGIEW